jgi:AraC family transcriptional regulator
MVSVAEPARPPLRLATWSAGNGDRVRITALYRSALVAMGTFWCAPDDVRWSLENFVGEVAHIVFPTMPVWIAAQGHEPELAGPNHAVFFNAGDVFRRRRFNGHGDRNDFIVVGQDTLDEWLRDARFPTPLGKLYPRPYLAVRAIARALANGADGLMVEEQLLRLGHATVVGAFRSQDWVPLRRRRRSPAVVEDAKALLSARFTEHLTLEELGREINVSPFHLARSFRRHTGYTLHEYRVNLRLKAALERLAAGDEDVAVIARAVGFSSHSHLTASFRRAFGVPPSCVRKRALPPQL